MLTGVFCCWFGDALAEVVMLLRDIKIKRVLRGLEWMGGKIYFWQDYYGVRQNQWALTNDWVSPFFFCSRFGLGCRCVIATRF
ncbi:MAG: hypothetical protein C4516_08640 [Oxalobacter sp.]|nr:MAG: hypothetical protein C4516_08640 [Oxalobacter sp.]